jgi:biopolymer transport protein ExbB/TolQ
MIIIIIVVVVVLVFVVVIFVIVAIVVVIVIIIIIIVVVVLKHMRVSRKADSVWRWALLSPSQIGRICLEIMSGVENTFLFSRPFHLCHLFHKSVLFLHLAQAELTF